MVVKSGFNSAYAIPVGTLFALGIVLSVFMSDVENSIVYFLLVPFIPVVDSVFRWKGWKYGEYVDFALHVFAFELLIIPFCDTDVLFFAFTHLIIIFARINHYITEGISKKRMFAL